MDDVDPQECFNFATSARVDVPDGVGSAMPAGTVEKPAEARRIGNTQVGAIETALAERFGADELAHRHTLLTSPGPLAAGLRALEAQMAGAIDWLVELWRWVLFLEIVRGYRGQSTVATYLTHVSQFCRYVAAHDLDYARLTHVQMDAWQRWLYLSRRNTAVTRRAALTAVRSFYRWRASRVGAVDVTAGYPAPKHWHRTPRKYTPADLRQLLAAARDSIPEPAALRDTTMLLLLYATGLRREEIAKLAISQVDIGERTAQIRCVGKGAKERTIPIEGPIVTKLREWILARAELPTQDETMFVQTARNRVGLPLTLRAIEMIVARCARRAGLKEWGVHRFRVTFATTLYDDGVDIERIRILMGHESIETTRRYLAVSNRMNRCRLKAHRQHSALGTVPADLPLWARELEKKRHGFSGVL